MALPLVDFHDTHAAGPAIDAAFARFGFLQMANIGLSRNELEQVFAASKEFFYGPADVKRRCGYRSAAENFGYQGLLEENLDPDAPADLKETFTMRNIVNSPPSPDRWPSDEFRMVMSAFYRRVLECAHAVQREMARALDLPAEYFTRCHSGQNVTLRLLFYPAIQAPAPVERQMGAGAHTDYGFMTLLFQHGVGGLQVVDRNGEWIDVPPRDDAVGVNSGDMLERWTNGRYRSTMHRVVPGTGDRDRFSIAVFMDPDSDSMIEALPSCVSASNPASFAPVSAGQHLQSRLEASHKQRFAR